MPILFKAIWMAAVPQDKATAALAPSLSIISFSNSLTFLPRGAIQLVSNASLIYFCS